ncbi:glycosyltransferase [Roseovarius sp. 2305UL8-3]|uniref:glycosyltransferase n=1 Tax=Roseovarius conchicola TaxID=3121636 RepID=UPI00352955A6
MAEAGMGSIQILMGVCEGADHLPAQLHSLAAQSHGQWRLLASDDSAGGESRVVLEAFAGDVAQEVSVISGPRSGFAANYLHLIGQSGPGPLAFADQDDVWTADKLARAVAALTPLPADVPALYCARVRPWDGSEDHTQRSMPPLARPPGFANALIENVATGNTIVLNAAAAALARRMARRIDALFAHDWWLYQLVSGVGGHVLHDDGPPVVLYRQHAGNAIGAGRGALAQLARKRAVLGGAFARRLNLNAGALRHMRDDLTPENSALFDAFEEARAQRGLSRVRAFARLGLYRQRPLGTAGFFGAAALGLV